MKKFSIAALLVPFLPLFAACSSGQFLVGTDQSASNGDPSIDGGSCVTDKDCASSESCGFLDSDQCTALGRCFSSTGVQCAAYSAGCACDGSEINVACTPFPTGYASKPLAHTGACGGGGGADASPSICTTDADCGGGNEHCGFLETDKCSATGQCFASSGVECAAYSPGCACDGSEINVACTPFPNGYVSKPFAHAGACSTETDGGIGAADAGR